jgi:hypothetical protein
MPDVKSYAWAQTVGDAVPIDGELTVLTPGFETPSNYDTEHIGAVHNGTELKPDEFTSSWEEDFSHVHLVNRTAVEWLPGDTVYVTVPGKSYDPADIEASFAALEARVSANETAIAALDTRVATLETLVPPASRTDAPEPVPEPERKADKLA